MRRSILFPLSTFLFPLLLVSCYNRGPITPDAWNLTEQQIDSISFYTTHHYTQNYNFIVTSDSLVVIAQQPEAMPIPEVFSSLHGAADSSPPDDPISQFIDFFSDVHLLVFLAFCVVIVAAYGVRRLMRRGAKIVHFNDIPSFYPTTLCLLVASSAVLYSSIQLFGPESWRHFYYHPSLNPFGMPLHLGLFVTSVWAIVIVAIATVDDVTKHLPLGSAILYLGGLTAVCAVDYVIFSITTLYYIGYPLLIAYYIFALRRLSLQDSI